MFSSLSTRVCPLKKGANLFFILLVIASLSTGIASENARKPRWAVIATDSSSQVLADLVSLELTRSDQVEVVERSQVDLVLNELKLASSGLLNSSESHRFGQIAQAEGLILIDGETNQKLRRLRLVETRTSIRFLDRMLPVDEWGKEVSAIRSELELALQKMAMPVDKRILVSLVPIKSEEPGDFLRPLCRALTPLLETDLYRQPHFILLERSELQRLQQESKLSGLELDLYGSTRLIELGVRRGDGGKGFALSCRAAPPGSATAPFPIVVEGSTANDIRSAIVAALVERFGNGAQVIGNPISPEMEAQALDQRRVWFSRSYRFEDAAELAETALALAPSMDRINATVQQFDSILHEYTNGGQVHPQSLTIEKRLNELAIQRLEWIYQLQDADQFLRDYRGYAGAVYKDSESAKPILLKMQQRAINEMARKLESVPPEPRVRVGVLFEKLDLLPWLTNSPREYIQEMTPLFLEFVSTGEQIRDTDSQPVGVFDQVTFQRMVLLRRFYMSLNAISESDPIRSVTNRFEEQLEAHPSSSIRMAQLLGKSYLSNERGSRAAFDLLAMLRQAPLELQNSNLVGQTIRRDMPKRIYRTPLESNYFQAMIAHAEASGDVSELIEQTPFLFAFLQKSEPLEKQRFGDAILASLAATKKSSQKIESLRRNISTFLGETAKSKEASMREPMGPWTNFLYKSIPLTNIDKNNVQLVSVQVSDRLHSKGEEEIILVWSRRFSHLSLEKVGLDGGTPVPIAPEIPGATFSFRGVQIAVSPEAIFVGSEAPGLTVIDRGSQKFKVFTQTEGAPSDEIHCMAWFKNRLYIGFKDTFASFDPATKKFRMLASSLSAAPVNLLDGRGSFFINAMLADEENQCVWMSIQDNAIPRDRNGFWRYFPEQDKYEKLSGNNVSFASSKTTMTLHLSDEKPWRIVDKRSGKVTSLSHNDFPTSGSYSASRAGFVAIDDLIISNAGYALSPDGSFVEYPNSKDWLWLQPLGNGFLTHFDERSRALRYFERK